MSKAELFYVDGSPFARLCRMLVLEWNLPVALVELPHPLPESFFDDAPLGQVPLLKTVGESTFPTLPIVEQLWAMTEFSVEPDFDPMEDRQKLAATLAMMDLLVAARAIEWSGLGPVAPNRLGFDVRERNLSRVQHMLDWLEPRTDPADISVCNFALAAVLLWTDSRGPIEWRDRANIATMVDGLAQRESFVQTVPKPWG